MVGGAHVGSKRIFGVPPGHHQQERWIGRIRPDLQALKSRPAVYSAQSTSERGNDRFAAGLGNRDIADGDEWGHNFRRTQVRPFHRWLSLPSRACTCPLFSMPHQTGPGPASGSFNQWRSRSFRESVSYCVSMSLLADDEAELRAAYVATRSLLRTRDALAAQHIVLTLCRALGADVASADADLPDSVPMDISLGEGEPLLPVTGDPRVRSLLSRYLVPAVSDARSIVESGLSSERLVQMATIDTLTGVWSRASLTYAVNHMSREDCVALIDLDHFKNINDTLGHDAGDTVLASFAAHLRSGVRDRDMVGRFGGEEFVVVFPATTLEGAYDVLTRLRASWQAVSTLPITFSAGIAAVTALDGDSRPAGQTALKSADALMYAAKSAGRDRVECQQSSTLDSAPIESAEV
jgi:diguanylate cyclase (GGDEF)-like protein